MLLYAGMLAVYAITIKIGLLGNLWTLGSVLRSRRPNNRTSLSPSDRLRNYIGLLAVVDLFVIIMLTVRIVIFVVLPFILGIDELSCRAIFILNRLSRFMSLLCLACISFERFITICKPFNSRLRKRLIQFTPMVALSVLLFVLSAIVLLSLNIGANLDSTECQQVMINNDLSTKIARWISEIGFITLLLFVTCFYGQIVRHVRRKFLARKARVAANARAVNKQINEPRYLRGMTAAIVRIASFHVVCLLPYSILQLVPNTWFNETSLLQLFNGDEQSGWLAWALLVADFLSNFASSVNWVFYCAMNRDLRTIIRESTERRKRSTFSNNSPPSNLHKSIRRQMAQSLRFFYSINSYKSRGNSFDDSMTTQKNGSFDSQNSSPLVAARSASTAAVPTTEGLFGMRNGRLHTYCSPRSSNGLSNGGSVKDYSPSASNASRILTIIQQPTQAAEQRVPRSFLAGIFRSDKTDSSLERFV